jgi:hypothetical protein
MALLRVPFLSNLSKVKRLKFLECFHRDWFENMLIPDEKWLYINNEKYGKLKKGIYLADRMDRRRFLRCQQGKTKVQVWAGVSLNQGSTIPVLTIGNVKAKHYKKMLADHVEPKFGAKFRDGTMTFQQDNAKIHTCDETRKVIVGLGWQTFKWPPNSCDFSPIEFVWAMMAAEIEKNWHPKNETELIRAIGYVWPEVSKPEVLERCFHRAYSNMHASHNIDGCNSYFRKCIRKVLGGPGKTSASRVHFRRKQIQK